ncbi:unnamed protein product [Spodoptera exigua]|nr:unnamed protein product [Spodoptera exigua]
MTKMIGKRKTLPKPNFQLLNNKLEKEIQGLVYSFNFALKIFCASKYSVRNNRLYPRGNKYQFFAFCFTVFMGFICTYRMFTIDITDPNMSESENDTVNLLSVLYYFLYTIGFTLMFILDSIHKQDNVFFFIEIQAIHLSVDFSKNMRSYIIFNWIYLFMIMFIDIYMYGIKSCSKYIYPQFNVFVHCALHVKTIHIIWWWLWKSHALARMGRPDLNDTTPSYETSVKRSQRCVAPSE